MKGRKRGGAQDVGREPLPKVVLNPGDIIVPDTNVMLRAIGFDNTVGWEPVLLFLLTNVKSLRVPKKVQEEIVGTAGRRDAPPEYRKRLAMMGRYEVIDGEPDPGVLSHMRKEHKRVADCPESKKAAEWLRVKQRAIKSRPESGAAEPGRTEYDRKASMLSKIYEDAENDRVIVAQAATLVSGRGAARAGKGGSRGSGGSVDGTVYLVSNDSDITLFAGKILDATDRAVKPVRLSQLVGA